MTTLNQQPSEYSNQIIASTDDLKNFFSLNSKKPNEFKIGMEWELLAVDCEGNAISYNQGPENIQLILQRLAQEYKWNTSYINHNLLELERDGLIVTLEPGSQLELVGKPYLNLTEIYQELLNFENELIHISKPYNIHWITLGCQPKTSAEKIQCIPKDRYEIMSHYLPEQGHMAHVMMRSTATQQANFDYENLDDAAQKLQVGQMLAPILRALSAHSPFYNLQAGPWQSMRGLAWLNTDPKRCGFCPSILKDDFNIEDYINYVLEIPMMFLIQNQKHIPVPHLTFRQFMQHGYEGQPATLQDWHHMLTTIFPEARLKKCIEIRSIDRNPALFAMAIIALCKGILYSASNRKKIKEIFKFWHIQDLYKALEEASLNGLKAKTPSGLLLELAQEIYHLAYQSLISIQDKKFLEHLRPWLFEKQTNPAELLLHYWYSNWDKNIQDLIQFTGIDPKELRHAHNRISMNKLNISV